MGCLAFFSSLHAKSNTKNNSAPPCCPSDDCCEPPAPVVCPCPCPSQFKQGEPLCPNTYPKAYNAPARVDVTGCWDLDIYGSFIYWHVSEEGLALGTKTVATTGITTTDTPVAVAVQPFDYKPGFKVGIGFDLGHDDWVCFAEYTRLHQTTVFSETLDPDFYWTPNNLIFPVLSDTYFPSTLTSEWQMNFDMADLCFSRPFYQGTFLTLSPYGGMRGILLTQAISVASNPNEVNVATGTTRSRCWGVGPNGGIVTNWLLGSGFRFEGMAGASLLYTRYTKLAHETNASPGASFGIGVDVEASLSDYNVLRPVMELGVGIGWGRYVRCNNWHVDLSLRYDFLQFWKQNMLREFNFMIGAATAPGNDLQMHGLTATARFDF